MTPRARDAVLTALRARHPGVAFVAVQGDARTKRKAVRSRDPRGDPAK